MAKTTTTSTAFRSLSSIDPPVRPIHDGDARDRSQRKLRLVVGAFCRRRETTEELPALKDLVRDLRRMVALGIGRLPDDIALPALFELVLVHQDVVSAGSLSVVLAGERAVRRAIDTFDGTAAHPVLLALFGLIPELNAALAKQRRRAAADRARSNPDTFVRHGEPRYLELLARRLLELETEVRLRAERAGPPPDPAEVRATWLERFTCYQRIASILRQLRLDLLAVLVTYRQDFGETSQVDYLDTTLWYLARFLSEVDAFGKDMGGIWMMPDPAADDDAKSAIDLVVWDTPFNERGRSWLRTTLAQVTNGELFDFAERVHDGPDGNELMGLWEQWLRTCRCDLDREPSQDCRPHRVVDQAERFDIVMEENWTAVRLRFGIN